MKPRSLLAEATLLAFLTTQGICPVPALALRPSMEGVQSGLEEKLTGPEENIKADWQRTGSELRFVLQVLDRFLSQPAIERKVQSRDRRRKPPEIGILGELKSIQDSLHSLRSLFSDPPTTHREQMDELLQAAQGFIQNAWKGINHLDNEFRGQFPDGLSFLSLDQPIYQRMLLYDDGSDWRKVQEKLAQHGLVSPLAATTGLEESELQQGWRAVRAGDSNQAAMQWSRWIQRNGLDALYENLADRLKGLQRRSSKSGMKEFSEALYAAHLVLADPSNTGSMGTAKVDRWRERFSDLEDQAFLLNGEVGKDQRLRMRTRLDRMPERQRLRYLRQAAGFRTPAKLERAAHVAHAVVSRFEQGTRGLGPHTARKIRQLLEKRTGLALTLSFRVLRFSLDQDLNPLPSADARFAFIKEELLGWSYGQLPRIASPYRSYEQAAHRTRRALRQVLEEGLSKRWHIPVQLDGQLRVLTHSARDHLPGLKSVEERLRWLRDEVLIWSRAELMRRARVGRTLLRESLLPQGIPWAAWRRVRRQLEQGLAERGEKIRLDDRLLPVDRPQPESTERLLKQLLPAEERLRTNFRVRLAARRELMRRFIRPVSSDPSARAQEQAQILMGLIGEMDILRLSALRQGNGARPSGATRYATGRDFVRWATSASVYPQVRRILSAMHAEEASNTLGWLAQMSSQTKIWKPLSRKLETLWVSAGGRSTTGLEEKEAARAVAVAAEAVQGPGVVVIGPEALEMRAGLEEFIRRAPPALARRIILYGIGITLAKRLQELNPQVYVIAAEDFSALTLQLLSMPEAEKVTVLGALALVQQLQQVLPATMAVARQDPAAAFRLILAAMGVPEQVLNQINTSGVEGLFAGARAA